MTQFLCESRKTKQEIMMKFHLRNCIKVKEAGVIFSEAQFIKNLINYVNLCRLHQRFTNGCISYRICYYALVEIK